MLFLFFLGCEILGKIDLWLPHKRVTTLFWSHSCLENGVCSQRCFLMSFSDAEGFNDLFGDFMLLVRGS